tara:strand:+ start:58 stop:759 length:702 start_codon:yes stop_codon:yes gene_type:complete
MAWRGIFQLTVLLLGLSLAGCGAAPGTPSADKAPGATVESAVWVMSNGWHSEIILRRAHIPPDLIPEIAAYAEADYFAFGWGDALYYPARSPGLELAIKAIATPTPAVMHLTAIPTTPERYYLEAEVLRLPITAPGLKSLVRYIHDSFRRGAGKRALKTGPGLYRHSGFYPATGRFHLFNTCNTWTARGLMRAGLPVGLSRAIQAEALMRQLRPIAAGEAPQDNPELRPYYFP